MKDQKFMNAAYLWQAVMVQAVSDYHSGLESADWFSSDQAVWILAVLTLAGLVDDTVDQAEAIARRAA
jgi:hypothetical protein